MMKWDNTGFKTPRARVEGLGSAKSGVHHWMHQRITAIGNLFLVLWLVWSICTHDFSSYIIFDAWISAPINATLMILLVICAFYHAVLGMQVVTEDYVHHEGLKIVKLISQRLIYIAMAALCIISILKLAFT